MSSRQLSKKILCSVLAAGVLSIGGVQCVWAASGDYAGHGNAVTDESLTNYSDKKVIGGWDIYSGNLTDGGSAETNTSITISSGTFDDIIGGSHIKQPVKDYTDKNFTVNIGNTDINITGGEFTGAVIGGSKANNSDKTILNVGNINVDISNGTFAGIIVGGNNIKSTGNPGGGTPAENTATAGDVKVNISGGTFGNTVYGGSVADNYGTVQADGKPVLKATDNSTELTITGGTFNNGVFGAGMANGTSSVINVGTAKLTIIDNGTNENPGVTINGGRIIGGGDAVNGGTVNVANTEVTIDGLKAGEYAKALYAGSNNAGVSNTTKLTIKNAVLGNGDNKWGIYGGSRINDISNTEINDAKDMYIDIDDSHLAADVRGGAGLFVSNTIVTNGTSVVDIKNTTVDGYSDNNNNDWSGRVFGAGILQSSTDSMLVHENTNVLVENVGGKTYDKDTGETVINENPGTEIYGGGQLYSGKQSILNVKNANIIIDGEETALNSVFGGNTISGTISKNLASVAVVGNTDVVVNNGNITNYLIGGNTTNWFGTSVVGILDDENGQYEYNGHKYNAGSTKVTLNNGGNEDTLMVIGGSSSTYGWYYNQNGKREAVVYGKTEVNINGGAASDVIGAGYASYYNDESVGNGILNDEAPISNVYGNTNVNINGGVISNNVIGGGLAVSTHKELASKANVEGNTNITVTAGEIKGNIIAGGYAEGEGVQANVSGTATINMQGGSVAGNVIVGGYAEGGATATTEKAVLNYENGTISGDIIATATKADINIGNVDFNNKFTSQGSEMNIFGEFVFTEDNVLTTTNDGTINLAGGNMSGQLYIQSGVVNLNGATFTTNNIENDIAGGGKLVLKDSGVLSTTADQIFTNGESEKVTATDKVNGILGSTADKVTFESGTVSLTDAEYTFDFVKSAVDAMGKHPYDGVNTSKTGIVMTGDLVGGIEDNKISVDDAASVGDDIALDKVTVEADNNLLVGAVVDDNTEVESITIHDSVTNGFNAGSLNLAEGSTGMVITNDKNVTLGGSEGGSIITVTNNKNAAVNVVVGTNNLVDGATSTTGSFTIGNALATAETEYTLKGSVTVNADSNLTTNGKTTITEGVTLNGGNLDVASGALNANVNVEANSTNTITGTINADTLTGAEGAVINVGTAEKNASTSIEDANLNGATICFDPDWDQEAGTHGIAFVDESGNVADIDGKVLVGRNNYVGVGTADSQAAKEMFAKTGLTFGEDDITAVLYIAGNQTLAENGAIFVDGSKAGAGDFDTVSGGTFTAAANSVTMVDGQSIKDTAALSGVTAATIADSAKLYIDNAKKGDTYKILAGSGIESGKVWTDDNIISDNSLLVFAGNATGNDFNVTASYDKVDNVYGEGAVVIADVVDKTLADEDEGNAAFDFFNAAASSKNNATKDAQVVAFNSAANMGEMGGVNHVAYSVSNAMTDAVADHLSIATHGDQDKDIWAHYVHNKENIEGISLGGINADYDLQYNGIVVGSDLYKNGKATAGIALSYIEGDVTNSNIASNTKNEAEYYGASVYGRIDNGNSAVLGDITYMHGSSDITQQNSGYKLTADADTDVFSIGVRAEQKVEAGIGQFVPYVGLRYMHIGTGNYTNSIGMSYDVDEQNLWLLPVGVTYSCEAQKGDWTIRPVVEAGYVWAMGDRDTNQTVSLNGAADGFGFDTADSGSFISRFAVEAEKANVVYSLGYEYQKGDTVKANKWMANMTFTF